MDVQPERTYTPSHYGLQTLDQFPVHQYYLETYLEATIFTSAQLDEELKKRGNESRAGDSFEKEMRG